MDTPKPHIKIVPHSPVNTKKTAQKFEKKRKNKRDNEQ
jgi:hypothetical protein